MNKTSSSINYRHRQANKKKLMHQIVRQHVVRSKKKKDNVSRRWLQSNKEDAELSTLKLMVDETSSSDLSENMRNKTVSTAASCLSSHEASLYVNTV